MKIYVGQTMNPKIRWNQHKASVKKPLFPIGRALAKYGISHFIFQIIEKWEIPTEADQAEAFWIDFFHSKNSEYGYNILPGGNSHPRTIEQKEKIRQTLLGKKHTPERRTNQSKAHTGKPLSEQHKLSLKEAWKPNDGCFKPGNNAPPTAFKKGMVPWNKGKTYKISKTYKNKGRTRFSIEQIQEMKQLSENGISFRKIAKQFNCNHQTVKKLIMTHV